MEKMDKQGQQQEKLAEKKEQQAKPPEQKDNGRPPNKLDEEPRKKRVDTPKNKPGLAELFDWVSNAYDSTSMITEGYLYSKNKKNLRQLTKEQASELEDLRVYTLLNLTPMGDLSGTSIHKAISSDFKQMPAKLKALAKYRGQIESYRKSIVGCYTEYLFNEK
jgi:hypothetical protein